MSRRSLVILPLVLLCAMFFPPPAVAVSTLNYFASPSPNTCTSQLSWGGAWKTTRIYPEPSNQCPGLAVYHRINGADGPGVVAPGATESYYVKDGWIWIMNEIFYNRSTGAVTKNRAFRNQANFWKGFKWLPVYFSGTSFYWNPQPYVEEDWMNSSGQPVCFGTQQTTVAGSIISSQVHANVRLPGHLQDRRASSANPNVWHDVDAILLVYIWGGTAYNYEYFWYGRWRDPQTGSWAPLGLVKFEWWLGGSLQRREDFRYLVDCTTTLPCTTCPP